ncbi:hypothetical protein PQX77_017871 [Marasmius sp. AFHP31]|nr:hypothetical protein PQX77_017871 [Marasmius sp. AFHP31]
MATAIHTNATTNTIPTPTIGTVSTAATPKPAMMTIKFFHADAALFDMDGTLTDSISSVKAAWSRVAQQLNMDKDYVIGATHGKRPIDNLRRLKPHLQELHNDDMDPHVQEFEESDLLMRTIHMGPDPAVTRLSPHQQGATRFPPLLIRHPVDTRLVRTFVEVIFDCGQSNEETLVWNEAG